MERPIVPEQPVPLLTDAQLKALLAACEGTAFEDRRDLAIVRVLLSTGIRRSECAGLRYDADPDLSDVKLSENIIRVMGKGRRYRDLPLTPKTALAIRRYLRVRTEHRAAASSTLWLGKAGPMTGDGIYQVVRDRALRAGIGKAWTHLFRHIAAHRWLSDGGQEGDALRIFGWRSRTMLSRYGASAADERARAAFLKMAPGDRL